VISIQRSGACIWSAGEEIVRGNKKSYLCGTFINISN
jgi:hypothetical protein